MRGERTAAGPQAPIGCVLFCSVRPGWAATADRAGLCRVVGIATTGRGRPFQPLQRWLACVSISSRSTVSNGMRRSSDRSVIDATCHAADDLPPVATTATARAGADHAPGCAAAPRCDHRSVETECTIADGAREGATAQPAVFTSGGSSGGGRSRSEEWMDIRILCEAVG